MNMGGAAQLTEEEVADSPNQCRLSTRAVGAKSSSKGSIVCQRVHELNEGGN